MCRIWYAPIRAYLQRLIPEVRAMRAEIDAEAEGFPDLLARSAGILRELLAEALGSAPDWARPLGFADYFGIPHRRVRGQPPHPLRPPRRAVTRARPAPTTTTPLGGLPHPTTPSSRTAP